MSNIVPSDLPAIEVGLLARGGLSSSCLEVYMYCPALDNVRLILLDRPRVGDNILELSEILFSTIVAD